MNGPKHVELLTEKLNLYMQVHGAPCHRSKAATEFLKKNKTSVLEWPRNSPDLSPIENLRQAIKEVWVTEITREYCESLVSSMPHSIQAVIDSKGMNE